MGFNSGFKGLINDLMDFRGKVDGLLEVLQRFMSGETEKSHKDL